jgi:hypothetical protein
VGASRVGTDPWGLRLLQPGAGSVAQQGVGVERRAVGILPARCPLLGVGAPERVDGDDTRLERHARRTVGQPVGGGSC